jgi:hypothetical protein
MQHNGLSHTLSLRLGCHSNTPNLALILSRLVHPGNPNNLIIFYDHGMNRI